MRRQAGTIGLLLLCLKVSSAESIKKECNAAPFKRAAYLKRPLVLTRGGSSQQEEYDDNSNNDDTWMKVSALLDIESTFFADEKNGHYDSENLMESKEENDTVSETVVIDQTESPTDDSAKISVHEILATIEESEIGLNETEEAALNLTFYASKDGDGSESDPDGLPRRFLKMQKGCRKKAKEAFDATVSWRDKYDINNILQRPHPQFDACKVIFPHYFPGRDTSNNIIFVQRPGNLDMDLAHRNNVSNDDLIMHYVYTVEYCWNLIEPGPPDGVMTNVIDLSDISFEMIRSKEMIRFAKSFVKIMSSNYPSRSFKTLVINAPRWFNVGYNLFKPLLRESTKEKIQIYARGEKQDAALCKYLGDSVPVDLLTTHKKDKVDDGPTPGPNSVIEQELRTFCMRRLEEAGLEMKEVMA